MGIGVVRGKREKGSCGEGERADGYGRRGVDGWARRHRRHYWAGLGSSLSVLGSARHINAGLGFAHWR